LDLYSRRIIGWDMGERMTKELVVTALQRSMITQPPGLIHHSDRGGHIQGKSYTPQKLREERKVRSYDTVENRFLKWMLQ
jgi:putative transposase